jgi:hypothetical protein
MVEPEGENMRCLGILAAACLAGCAASKPAGTALAPQRPAYSDSPAASLAFAPPPSQSEPSVFLPRDVRQPSAFVGFEDVTATFFYIRSDDRQPFGSGNCPIRESIVERVGVSYR